MFTGLVEAMGTVATLGPRGAGWRLAVVVPRPIGEELRPGHSLAVNGACLTVVEIEGPRLGFDLAEETLRVTTFGDLRPGESVNLERPLRLGDRLGGHLVLGHVDEVGRIVEVTPEGAGRRLVLETPGALRGLLIPKGSVAVDGVSLTVADLDGNRLAVAVIPHTLAATTLGTRQAGARVNLEVDVIGKYVRAILGADEAAGELLSRWGPGMAVRGGQG
jgi:riboflavin synthase alpha subunit